MHTYDSASQRGYLIKIPRGQSACTYVKRKKLEQRDHGQSNLETDSHFRSPIPISLSCQAKEALLGDGDGVGGGRVVGDGCSGFAIGLDGFALLGQALISLAEQALDEGIVLVRF